MSTFLRQLADSECGGGAGGVEPASRQGDHTPFYMLIPASLSGTSGRRKNPDEP